MNEITIFYIFMSALFSSLIMTPFLIRWAANTGALDVPGGRKKHKKAVPRIGGVAIAMAWLVSLIVYVDLTREVLGIMAGALIIFFTGLIDDLFGLTAKRKLVGQAIACVVTMGVGQIHIDTLGKLFGPSSIVLAHWFAIPFTMIAIIGVVNAFNLMDGLDGLAGGISTIALSAFFILGYMSGNYLVMAIVAALLGGGLGFLKYNLYPARIFMGDTGSMLMGFVIAILAILLTQSPFAGVSPVVPLIILGLPVADTIRVMGCRLLKGISPFSPDRTHVHHRILDMGFKHRFTVIIIYGVSVLWASFAVLCRQWSDFHLLVSFVVLSAGFYAVMAFLRRNRARFYFMKKDSTAGIRLTVIYQRLCRFADYTPPFTLFLTFVYLLLAALFSAETSSVTSQVGVTLFVGCMILLCITRDTRNDFLLGMLAFVAVLIAYVLNQNNGVSFQGFVLGGLDNKILIALSVLVAFPFIFHDPRKPFLSPFDYLILGVAVFLLAASQGVFGDIVMAVVIVRGTILFLAMKACAMRGWVQSRLMFGSLMVVLMAIIVRGFVV